MVKINTINSHKTSQSSTVILKSSKYHPLFYIIMRSCPHTLSTKNCKRTLGHQVRMDANAIFLFFFLTITVELWNVFYGPIVIILIPLYVFAALVPFNSWGMFWSHEGWKLSKIMVLVSSLLKLFTMRMGCRRRDICRYHFCWELFC